MQHCTVQTILLCTYMLNYMAMCYYSGTSDSGLSRIGTLCKNLFTKDIISGPKIRPPFSSIHVWSPPSGDNLSTKDMTSGPKIRPPYNSNHVWNPPSGDNLSTKSKPAEFMSSQKCPLFGGSLYPPTLPYIESNGCRGFLFEDQ